MPSLLDQAAVAITRLNHLIFRATVWLMAIVVPVLCFVAVVALLYWAARSAGRVLFGRRNPPPRLPTAD